MVGEALLRRQVSKHTQFYTIGIIGIRYRGLRAVLCGGEAILCGFKTCGGAPGTSSRAICSSRPHRDRIAEKLLCSF